jgi:hypothetical protein
MHAPIERTVLVLSLLALLSGCAPADQPLNLVSGGEPVTTRRACDLLMIRW